ncbi:MULTISPECIES: BON domain-containing protein [unclassified Haematospirillum]|uniref:BON domain-containing protein n=1 Tax=unclassified Haematospirillum TaxID=2622088 RepID=UPI00143A8FFB|nr:MULTISPECIES: BON domain-containing protein [unclassified Haematospirillum]NKD55414.1 BON domain-containing protein [Haematospirillum sp. H4890]NKD75458.1 BON domain-containing protein [Haematospirillum sp. H4485]
MGVVFDSYSLHNACMRQKARGYNGLVPVFFLLLALFLTPGCTKQGVLVGAASSFVSAAREERGIEGVATDAWIYTEIQRLFLEEDHALITDIDVTVFERRVLLTGMTEDPRKARVAVRLAASPRPVIEVIDRIRRLSPDEDTEYLRPVVTLRDTLIAVEIRSALMFDAQIRAINFSVDVVDRVVYLMGIAQNQEELSRVLDWCRSAGYVRDVVNLAVLRTDGRRLASGTRLATDFPEGGL